MKMIDVRSRISKPLGRFKVISCVVAMCVFEAGCVTQSHFDPKHCEAIKMDVSFVEVRDPDRSALLASLQAAIEREPVMKPSYGSQYRQHVFRANNRAMLCQLGPCSPSVWLFEKKAGTWDLLNVDEGICVTP